MTKQASFDSSKPSIPRHELLQPIGAGSYGEVWLAQTLPGKKLRAAKFIYRCRFGKNQQHYQRAYEGINRYEDISMLHTSLMPIYLVGENQEEGYFYYTMELADNSDGDRWSREGPFQPKTLARVLGEEGCRVQKSVEETVKIGIELATALEHLHEHGLVHRDVKPSNIIFVHGAAKLADPDLAAESGVAKSYVGTEGFIPPEGPGEPSADVYALGKVLYEMSMGRDRCDFPALPPMYHLEETAKAELRNLNVVLLKACDPVRSQRHASARSLREELEQIRAGVSVERARAMERTVVRMKRWGQGAALVLLAGVVGGALWWQHRRAHQETKRVAELAQQKEMFLNSARLERPAQDRLAGWSHRVWTNVAQASRLQRDNRARIEIEALTSLAGVDAHLLVEYPEKQMTTTRTPFTGSAFTGAAFGPEDQLLAAGDGKEPGVLISASGEATVLAVSGPGPVCWTSEGVPLLLQAGSNSLVLREIRSNSVWRRFPLGEGEEVKRIDGFPVVATTPDGKWAAATLVTPQASPVVVRVWDATTGAALGQISEDATCLALRPDGARLAVGRAAGTVALHSLPGMEKTGEIPILLRRGPVGALAFGPDPLVPYDALNASDRWLLAVGDHGGGLVVWQADSQLPRAICSGSPNSVLSAAFHPDGFTLASAGRVYARVWDVPSGTPLLKLTGASRDAARALAFNRAGSLLAWGGVAGFTPGPLQVFRIEPDRGIQVLRGLSTFARQTWFSPDSRRLAALSDDWHLAVFDLPTGRLLRLFETPIGFTSDNADGTFDPTGDHFVFATGHEARWYHLTTGQTLKRWHLATGFSDQVDFDPSGRLLLLRREAPRGQASPHASAWRLYELGNNGDKRVLHEQTDPNWVSYITRLSAKTGRFLVINGGSRARGQQRVVKVFDIASGKEIHELPTELVVQDVTASLDPTRTWFSYLYSQRLAKTRLVRLLDLQVTHEDSNILCVGPAGDQYATPSGLGLAVWKVGKKAPLPLTLPDRTMPDWTTALLPDFSPDGKSIAWGTAAGVVLVADLDKVEKRLQDLATTPMPPLNMGIPPP